MPQLFVDQKYIGGYDEILQMDESGQLERLLIQFVDKWNRDIHLCNLEMTSPSVVLSTALLISFANVQ